MKQIILNIVKLAFTISLFVSFIGCGEEGGAITTPTGDIAFSNSIEDETINDDSGSGGEEQSDPKDTSEEQDGSDSPKGTGDGSDNEKQDASDGPDDKGTAEKQSAPKDTGEEQDGSDGPDDKGTGDESDNEKQDASDGPDDKGTGDGSNSENQGNPPPPPPPSPPPPAPSMVFFIENRANVSDNNSLELDGATGLTTAKVGGTTYLFVTGFLDNGFSVFSVANDGQLSSVKNVRDNSALKINGASRVTTAEVGGTTYLFVTGGFNDGFSVFSVNDNGKVKNRANVKDGGNLELDGAYGVTTAEVGGTTYLFVTGFIDYGFSMFRVANDGSVMNTTNVSDTSTLKLKEASIITTAEVGGTTYLFVTGYRDDGFSVFSVADDGRLSSVTDMSDNNSLELDGASGITTAEVGGTTYLFVTGFSDDGFSVFSMDDNGTLINTANVKDDGNLELDGAKGITTAEIDGTTYLFVTGYTDNGFSVFSVANDGQLSNVANVSDGGDLNLRKAEEITTAQINGKNYLFVTGFDDDGVSVFEFGLRPENP